MASLAHERKMQRFKNNTNPWHTDLMSTIQDDHPYCCFAFWCGPCVSYLLRKRALYNDMSRYVCCAGGRSCSGRCGERRCPKFCLATEVFCCFGESVASTRSLLQEEFTIQTTQCDECITGFMSCLRNIECICSLVAKLAGCGDECSFLSCVASMVIYCTVSACMQTQHKIEMDRRDGKFGPQVMAVPPVQQMSRIDQPVPPSVGYPPQATDGQPYGYPPPQARGCPKYPPSNYPPPGYPASGYSR